MKKDCPEGQKMLTDAKMVDLSGESPVYLPEDFLELTSQVDTSQNAEPQYSLNH